MKQKFIRKNTQVRFIRPARPQSTFVVDASDGTIKKDETSQTEVKSRKTTKNNAKEDMKKIDDINEIISDEQTVDNKEKSNATKKIGGKNSDGLMERIDVTLVTSDNKTLLTD